MPQGGAGPTTMTTSLDGPEAPQEFRARTRTKYVPFGTLLVLNVVVAPTSLDTMFADPDEVPASSTYDDAPAAAFHFSPTAPPVFAVSINPVGTAGSGHGDPPPTVRTISLDVSVAPR